MSEQRGANRAPEEKWDRKKNVYTGPEHGDWRDRYVHCIHIAEAGSDTEDVRHSGFRVCCNTCYPMFLFPKEEN